MGFEVVFDDFKHDCENGYFLFQKWVDEMKEIQINHVYTNETGRHEVEIFYSKGVGVTCRIDEKFVNTKLGEFKCLS